MARGTLRARLLTVLTAAVASAVVAAGIAVATADRGHDHDDHAHLDTADGLLVTNRPSLRMCVETGQDPDGVRSHLLAGLDQVRRDPNWSGAYGRTGFSRSNVLNFGCPAPKLPDRYERTTIAGPGVTDDPSGYRVWIYLLDDPTADRVLGAGRPAAVAPAELMREATSLFPVSTALLIRQARIADPAAVAQDLRTALGLDDGQPEHEQAE